MSDHFPLLLRMRTTHVAKRPFTFENVEVDGFSDFGKSLWGDFNASGCSSFVLAKKLNFLKSKIKEWNRDVFGHLETKLGAFVERVKQLDKEATLVERLERLEVKKELSLVCKWVDSFWRQRQCNIGFLMVIEILSYFIEWLIL